MPNTLQLTPLEAKQYFHRTLIEPLYQTEGFYHHIGYDKLATKTANSVEFRSVPILPVPSVPSELVEGVTPGELTLTVTNTTATVKEYGGFLTYTDQLDLMGIDPMREIMVQRIGTYMCGVLEQVIANLCSAQLNVQFSGGRTARNQLLATDVITRNDVINMIDTLRANKAPYNNAMADMKPNGKIVDSQYTLFVTRGQAADIQKDPDWKDYLITNPSSSGLPSGTVASWSGVNIMWSDFCPTFAGAGSGGAKVHQGFMFSMHWLHGIGIGQYAGGKGYFQNISKALGSSGVNDPLDQRGSEGAKGFQAWLIRQPGWLVKCESGSSRP